MVGPASRAGPVPRAERHRPRLSTERGGCRAAPFHRGSDGRLSHGGDVGRIWKYSRLSFFPPTFARTNSRSCSISALVKTFLTFVMYWSFLTWPTSSLSFFTSSGGTSRLYFFLPVITSMSSWVIFFAHSRVAGSTFFWRSCCAAWRCSRTFGRTNSCQSFSCFVSLSGTANAVARLHIGVHVYW